MICRARIKSQAVNISLQQVIQSLSEKQEEVKRQNAQNTQNWYQAGPQKGSQYAQQYRMYKTRVQVLANRCEDLKAELARVTEQADSGRLVLKHLRTEEDNVEHRLQQVSAKDAQTH